VRLYGVVVAPRAVVSSGVEAATGGAYTLCVHSDSSVDCGCGPGPGVPFTTRGTISFMTTLFYSII
jgi:hypothetical protein